MRRILAMLAAWTVLTVGVITSATAQTPPASAIVVNRNSGMCLEVPDGSASPTEPTAQRRCLDLKHQRWTFQPVAGGYQIVNRSSGFCLDIAEASTADGAAATQYPCGGFANQRFTVRAAGDWSEIVAAHSGKCLDVEGGSLDDGGDVIQWPCNGGDNQKWTLSARGPASEWSAKFSLPIVPVAASTLRNGKILAWSAYDRFAFGGDNGKTFTITFDPATNTTTKKMVTTTSHDMFCPGTAVLPNGRILVNGGSSSSRTSIYNPTVDRWSRGSAMNVPRGYQGDTVLSTGEVFTVGGSWNGGVGGKLAEVWTDAGGWRRLANVPAEALSGPDPGGVYRGDNHMWLFGVTDGHVFHAGPSAEMHWVSTSGDGSIISAGNRADDAYAMNGNVVSFDAGKLLKLGGAPAYENRQASDTAYVIDFSAGPGAAVVTARQKPMAFPRAFANAVALPNGQVVVVGGMSYPVPFSDDRSIMIPEIWTPETGAFKRLEVMRTPRNYHSVATLMTDGRVFVAGGGLCGGCATNHPDGEILTPPYLLNADGTPAERLAIVSAPQQILAGAQMRITTDRPVASFAMVRLSAVTHSVNNDQRRLPLPVVSTQDLDYRVAVPERGAAIAGDWMLFALSEAGAPSLAKIVRVK